MSIMRNHIFAAAMFLAVTTCAYADTIVFKDGTTLQVYNVEESGKWILYTAGKESDSDLKRVEASKVFAIKAENGEMRAVGQNAAADSPEPAAPESDGPVAVPARPAGNNAAAIAAYNNVTVQMKKPVKEKYHDRYCTDFLAFWGVGTNSILSDDNVEISFEPVTLKGRAGVYQYYKIKVANKTVKPLYIDLANSFRIDARGAAEPYYTNSVYTEGSSMGSGQSLNLGAVAGALGVGGVLGTLAGGIGIGKSSGKSASITSEEQRFLMIPPMASVYMPPVKFSDGTGIHEQYECLYLRNIPLANSGLLSEGAAKKCDEAKPYYNALEAQNGIDDSRWTRDVLAAPMGRVRTFDENSSPKKLSRLITYSTSPEFRTYTTIPLTLYIRGVMGSASVCNAPYFFDSKHLDCSDEGRLIWGKGQVRKN